MAFLSSLCLYLFQVNGFPYWINQLSSAKKSSTPFYDTKKKLTYFLSLRSWLRCRIRLFFAAFSANISRSSSFEIESCRFSSSFLRFSLKFDETQNYLIDWRWLWERIWERMQYLSINCSFSYSARRNSSSLRVLSTAESNKEVDIIKLLYGRRRMSEMNFLAVYLLYGHA